MIEAFEVLIGWFQRICHKGRCSSVGSLVLLSCNAGIFLLILLLNPWTDGTSENTESSLSSFQILRITKLALIKSHTGNEDSIQNTQK
ncbi:hypothetical protein QQP08_014937 [Theobroma cacao]|nr:hypothetical protein QQP08_014937 [Theobroma cacao]